MGGRTVGGGAERVDYLVRFVGGYSRVLPAPLALGLGLRPSMQTWRLEFSPGLLEVMVLGGGHLECWTYARVDDEQVLHGLTQSRGGL